VERLFGDKAWTDWLNIRKFLKGSLNLPLTPDLIKEAHRKLSEVSNPLIGGKVRAANVQGGDYKFLGKAVLFTDDQCQAIEQNPLLSFLQAGEEENRGLIIYPGGSSDIDNIGLSEKARLKCETGPKTTTALLEILLEDICNWYNAEKAKADHNPYKLAKDLQVKLVSSHIFIDFSGRLSRAFMYWSEESDGVPPSILEDSGDDLLTDSDKWQTKVEEGSVRYARVRKKAELLEKAGIENLAELYDLSEFNSFYNYIFSKFGEVPEIKDEDIMDHSPYNQFVRQFIGEFLKFKKDYSAKREIQTSDGRSFTLSQGGLVPQFYIDAIRAGTEIDPQMMALIKESYLHQEIVFRGGQALEKIDGVSDVLKLFTNPVALGADYKSLKNRNPLSLESVDRNSVADTLDWYNQLLANSYLRENHPDLAGFDPNSIGTLSSLINAHIHNNGLQKSPYSSTSFDYNGSSKWAKDVSLGNSNTQTGVLFELNAPNFGGVCTFSATGDNYSDIPQVKTSFTFEFEREMLIPGGVLPGMVEAVTVFDKPTKTEKFYARRFQSGEQACLVVVNRTGSADAITIYVFDKSVKGFVAAPDQAALLTDATQALLLGERAKSRSIVTNGLPLKDLITKYLGNGIDLGAKPFLESDIKQYKSDFEDLKFIYPIFDLEKEEIYKNSTTPLIGSSHMQPLLAKMLTSKNKPSIEAILGIPPSKSSLMTALYSGNFYESEDKSPNENNDFLPYVPSLIEGDTDSQLALFMAKLGILGKGENKTIKAGYGGNEYPTKKNATALMMAQQAKVNPYN
jgi:hypothetical protein